MSIIKVSLNRELSWSSRTKNRLMPAWGISKASSVLADLSQTQEVRVRAEAGRLDYFNTHTQSWVKVESSNRLGSRLEGSLSELKIETPVDTAILRSTFRALMKQPLTFLGGTSLDRGVTVKWSTGEELKFPITWKDLKKEIVPAPFGNSNRAHEWGAGFAWLIGVASVTAVGIYILDDKAAYLDGIVPRTDKGWPVPQLLQTGLSAFAGGLAGYVFGRILYTLKTIAVWVPTQLYRLARFGGEYKTVIRASNGQPLDQKQEGRLKRIFKNVSPATRLKIAQAVPLALLEGAEKERWDRDALLAVNPSTPIEKLKMLADNKDVQVRRAALSRLNGQLSLAEVESFKHLDAADVIDLLLEHRDLPDALFMPYLDGRKKVNDGGLWSSRQAAPDYAALYDKIYRRIQDGLTPADLARILMTNLRGARPEFYQAVWSHPKARGKDVVAAALNWFDGPLLVKAFDRFSAEFTREDLNELYANPRADIAGLKKEIIKHPLFSQAAKVEAVCQDKNREIREFALAQAHDHLSLSEMDRIIAANSAELYLGKTILEKMGRHPQIAAQALAGILLTVIPRSRKVVEKPEETETRTEYDDGYYGESIERMVVVVISSEKARFEYTDEDVNVALNYLNGKKPDYISQIMEALGPSELGVLLRARLDAVNV